MLAQGSFLSSLDPTEYPHFILILLGGGGLYSLIRGVRILWFGDGSLTWPRVDAVVQRTRIEHRIPMRGSVGVVGVVGQQGGYEVVIDFAYEVNGQTYTADRWSYDEKLIFATEGEAERKALQYREATKIVVRYDPADPERAVIKPGGGGAGMVKALGGVVLVLWALYGFLNS
jgi:hypothetical protein